MNLIFYCAPMSTASVTELVLEELAVPHEKIMLDLRKGDTKKPDFVKLNPNAVVPVIVHEGVPLWESSAITMYLGELFGVDKKLYPAPGPKRGEAMKWIAWSNVTLGDAVYRFARNTMQWVPAEQQNAKAGEVGKEDILRCLKIVDEALDGKQYLLGADYTLADTHLSGFLSWVRSMPIDFGPFKRLNAWSERCTARPAWKKLQSNG